MKAVQDLQSEEDEDLGPDAGMLHGRVDAEGFKGGEEDEDGGPSVVEGEGEMNPDFVVQALGSMMAAHDVVYMRDGGGNEQSEDEGCRGIEDMNESTKSQ